MWFLRAHLRGPQHLLAQNQLSVTLDASRSKIKPQVGLAQGHGKGRERERERGKRIPNSIQRSYFMLRSLVVTWPFSFQCFVSGLVVFSCHFSSMMLALCNTDVCLLFFICSFAVVRRCDLPYAAVAIVVCQWCHCNLLLLCSCGLPSITFDQ